MKIFVCSRQTIETTRPFPVPHLFISISTPGDPRGLAKLPVNELTRGALHMQFHDLDRLPPPHFPPPPAQSWLALHPPTPETLFNHKMARQVLDFVQPHVDQERVLRAADLGHTAVRAILVHCDAGLSRSPAVAAALSRTLLGQDDSHWFKVKTPNRLVYRHLVDAYQQRKQALLPRASG